MSDLTDLMDFPCEYELKVMGQPSEEFEKAVYTIVSKYFHPLSENAIRTRNSRNNKYISLSITVTVLNAEQLQEVYKELHANEHVIMTL